MKSKTATSLLRRRRRSHARFNLERFIFQRTSMSRPTQRIYLPIFTDQVLKIDEIGRRNQLDRGEVIRRLLDFALEAFYEQWEPDEEALPVDDLVAAEELL